MKQIEYLKREWGTGKDVRVAVDKLLRAEEEGADEDAMAGIARKFRAHQMAKKMGCDEIVWLDLYETCERWERFNKEEQMEKMKRWAEEALAPFSWQ